MTITTSSFRHRVLLPSEHEQPSYVRQGVPLVRQNMAKLVPRTTGPSFPAIDQKKKEEIGISKVPKVSKTTKKKHSPSSSIVTTPPTSASGTRTRRTSTTTRSRSKPSPPSSTKSSGHKSPSFVNVIKLQRSTSQMKLKDENPRENEQKTVEIKSGTYFYLPKRKIVHKPAQPFKLFIDQSHSLANLVWLYLLESQMPFEKISISSKEGTRASKTVPAFCKHCIFTDGDISIGQPTAILRYLCTYYTHNVLLGADTSQISQSFSWIHWATSVLHRDLYYLTNGELRKGATSILDSSRKELLQTSLDSVSLYFDMLEKIFTNRQFLLGDVAWFCDSAVALVLEDSNCLSLDSWVHVKSWLERVKTQPNWNLVTNNTLNNDKI